MNIQQCPPHHVYIVMGVSGSGKSTLANAVARQLNAAFLDGDFLHPRANIIKMSQGQALNDEDRMPWLAILSDAAFAMQQSVHEISLIACSSLKKCYRDHLRLNNKNLSFIYLKGDFDVIERRLKARHGHFFQSQLLITQFNILEEPNEDEQDVYAIDVNVPLKDVIAATVKHIHAKGTQAMEGSKEKL
ncbi:gluconokinase [Candidatus Regiella endosymbiont of Tuberolachnus salignus]|uniref:gluconokinase n=1 Tax=Candidatus Regiella endosymbiont of Tuberolachnus salignus TaxID=3077956 RepID=UPI0030CC4962